VDGCNWTVETFLEPPFHLAEFTQFLASEVGGGDLGDVAPVLHQQDCHDNGFNMSFTGP
jgi:hypothetical protein